MLQNWAFRYFWPIVQDEELDAGEAAQDACIAAVTAGERELGEELGNLGRHREPERAEGRARPALARGASPA